MPAPTVVAGIATRNRKDLLRESLNAIFAQTRPLQEVIVVDNASTDETLEMLAEEFPEVTVVALAENQGTAGGFSEAIAAARRMGFDWLWLLDDDSIARPTALAEFVGALEQLDGRAAPALLCGRVEWIDGSPHVMNRPIMPRQRQQNRTDQVRDGLLPIRAATFVSLLLSRGAVERVGLPWLRFFYGTDDIEYTARILRDAHGYYVPASIVEHRTAAQHTAVNDDRRLYWHVRNTILMIRRRGAWRAREKPRLAWWIIRASLVYLRINHLHPRSVANVVRGLVAGVLAPRR